MVRPGLGTVSDCLRLTGRPPEGLVARRLLDIEFRVCASPAYLARHGTPRRPSELTAHNCLLYGHEGFGNLWRFRAAGTQATPVMTEWALRRAIHWPALVREAGSLHAARAELSRCLDYVDVTRFPPPVAPELATVLVGKGDRIFPEESGRALHRHWPGAELVMTNGGHVTSAVLDETPHVDAIVSMFRRAGARQAVPRPARFQQLFTLAAAYPTNALSFLGLGQRLAR